MPLNWSIRDCDNWESLVADGEAAVTEALVFGAMFIGIHNITADNAGDFYARIKMMEAAFGPLVKKFIDDEVVDYYMTQSDIRARVGLSTNASTITKTAYLRMVHEKMAESYEKDLVNA